MNQSQTNEIQLPPELLSLLPFDLQGVLKKFIYLKKIRRTGSVTFNLLNGTVNSRIKEDLVSYILPKEKNL